jgi:hypothetical protein
VIPDEAITIHNLPEVLAAGTVDIIATSLADVTTIMGPEIFTLQIAEVNTTPCPNVLHHHSRGLTVLRLTGARSAAGGGVC